jgi:hypothetical protein
MRAVDISGQRFERLLAIKRVSSDKRGVIWQFACDCGKEYFGLAKAVRYGKVRSCGCLAKDVWSERMTNMNFKHGMTNTRTWKSWSTMWDRCTNPNAPKYKLYGGRGISICAKWKDFENFYTDMGERPAGLTLDRIDVNGNYEPSNCRWATNIEQRHNRRA